MTAETWSDADTAVEKGFADTKVGAKTASNQSDGPFKNAPDGFLERVRGEYQSRSRLAAAKAREMGAVVG